MKYDFLQPGEDEALQVLAASEDPMVRVIYHMSMRQLAVTESLRDLKDQTNRVETEVMRQGGIQRRLVEYLDAKLSNGSSSSLKTVVLGVGPEENDSH